MNFLRQICIVIGCLATIAANGQSFMEQTDFIKANSIWNFGEHAGLDFNSGSPVPINTPGYASQYRGCASLCSPQTGELLFYSDGLNCFDKNHVIMPNGELSADPFRDVGLQGVCIVPFVNDANKYYLFHMEAGMKESSSGNPIVGVIHHKLYYSVIDMNLNGGNGDIVPGSKSIFIDEMLTGSIISVPGDNCDIWLIAHSTSEGDVFAHPYFKAFHITTSGLQLTPVVSTIINSGIATAFPPPGIIVGTPFAQAYMHTHMTISPNRQMLAVGVWNGDFGTLYPDGPLGPVTNFNSPPMDMTSNNPGTTIKGHAAGLLGYQFNPATGVISNEIFMRNLGSVIGVCFSPDNSKLYASLQGPSNCMLLNCTGPNDYRGGSAISQYNMSTWDSAAVVSSKFDVFKSPSNTDLENYWFRLYNNKIYFTRYGCFSHIGMIHNPNLAGNACGYQDSVITLLNGTFLYDAFPNQVVFPAKETVSTQKDTIICGTFSPVTLHANSDGNNHEWDNGSTGPTRTVTTPGTYWVRYVKDDLCTYYVDTIKVKGNSGNHAIIDYDAQNCNNTAVLTSRLQADSYLWSTGATQKSITVNASGKYWLRVGKDGCYSSDTVQVKICECAVHIPSAFSPNGDGMNDVFKPILSTDCSSIKPYTLSIYNRYGERVFNSTDPDKGWDGRYPDGGQADGGTYFFRVSYHKYGGKETKNKNGDLTLIR